MITIIFKVIMAKYIIHDAHSKKCNTFLHSEIKHHLFSETQIVLIKVPHWLKAIYLRLVCIIHALYSNKNS